jgi:hypothetical protein
MYNFFYSGNATTTQVFQAQSQKKKLEKFGVQVTISSRLRRYEFIISLVALSNFLDFLGGELPAFL